MLVRTAFAISFLGLVALAAWVLHSVPSEDENGFLQWRDPQVTSAGRKLYTAHCAACHGMPDGTAASVASVPAPAAGPPHDETGHTWQHPDFALFQLIRDGVAVANCVPVDPELMPMFKDIVSDAELVAILSYIKSTWPEDIRLNHDRVNMMYGPYNRAVGQLIEAGPEERG